MLTAYIKTGLALQAARLDSLANTLQGESRDYLADRGAELLKRYPWMLGRNMAAEKITQEGWQKLILESLARELSVVDGADRHLRRMRAEMNGRLAQAKAADATRAAVNSLMDKARPAPLE